jgi:hypothetical protein
VDSPRSAIEYWHLLSLDAPTVAALWSYFFCSAAHLRASPAAALFVGMGTWLLYAADRILDGTRAAEPRLLQERHHFHARHRRAFVVAGVAVAASLVWLTVAHLPAAMLSNFAGVLLAALVYFALVHSKMPVVERWLPKEMTVGVIFASAVAVPAWSQLHSGGIRLELVPGVALFAALCWLNCAAIESWEHPETDAQHSGSTSSASENIIGAWATRRIRGLISGLAVASSICLLVASAHGRGIAEESGPGVIYSSVLASSLTLLLLDYFRSRLLPIHLRIAADAALLTPVVLLAVARL